MTPAMTPEAWEVLVLIGAAIVLFATEWLSIDLVALLLMATLALLGLVTPAEAVAGFSSPATLTVAFMFVLSAALLKTGALQVLVQRVTGLFRAHPSLGIVSMLLTVAVMSAFINNTPIVAVFIPVVIQLSTAIGVAPTRLLIPLSFASIFGGCCTLIGTSTNILVSGVVSDMGLPPIGMFQMAPVGLVFVVVGIAYLMLVGRHLLPDRRAEPDAAEAFDLEGYLTEIELLAGFPDLGLPLGESLLASEWDLDVLELRRANGRRHAHPGPDMTLDAGDVLKVPCSVETLGRLQASARNLPPGTLRIGGIAGADGQRRNSSLVELVVTAHSPYRGKTMGELNMAGRHGLIPLALRHHGGEGGIAHEDLDAVKLQAGDVLLADVPWREMDRLKESLSRLDRPFLLLSETAKDEFKPRRFWLVVGVFAAIIAAASLGWVDILVATLAGVAVLIAARNMTMEEAYGAIHWKVIFLLAGTLSLGKAMQASGLDRVLAGLLVEGLGAFGPLAVLSGLYLATALLTEIMSNNATAVLTAPIAVAAAAELGVSPTPLVMAVCFAASASFMTPIGYQTNTMVYGAGAYRFADFPRVGAGLSLLFWIIATLMLPVVYPF
jgi:di/tricarboxylate transporter